jgi:transposase
MLKMAQIEYIKHLYEVEGKSLRTIAKTMNLNFRTVKKYAVQSDWSSSTNTNRKSNYPVLGEYLDIIDSWLEDDTKQPRKQRHTGKRVYDRLKEEYGFNGGLRTVTEYVSRKKKLLAESIEGYLPLEHLPAESQLDFGEFKYIDGHGEDKKAYYLTLSFPYSNAAFTQVFKGQNQECLMEGMKIIFSHINGVPPSIMMDNMKTVVTKVLKFGEREISEGFRRFALHYRFKPIFCNPSSGNEKGNVENKVGYHRRNWFVPVPVIEDFEEFNESLWLKAHNDMNRTHYKKEIPISSLWQQEQAKLLYLPENEYEVFKLEQVRVDNYGFIDVDGNSYCASPELCSNIVTAKIYFNKVAIYHEHSLIKEYRRSYGKKDEIYDWKQYITLLCKKPGALEHTKFYSQIPKLWREHIEKLERSERKTALMLLREIVAEDALDIGNEALAIANLYGKSDTESIRQCYYSLTHETRSLEPCKFDISPPIISYEPKLSEYDKLTDMGVM